VWLNLTGRGVKRFLAMLLNQCDHKPVRTVSKAGRHLGEADGCGNWAGYPMFRS